MRHLEDSMQIACVTWFHLQHPDLEVYLHHSPNGGRRNAREAARFKAMGTRAGFPDLVLMLPRHGHPYLAIELKVGKNRQTEGQKAMQAAMEKAGAMYVVVRSLKEFIDTVQEYLN